MTRALCIGKWWLFDSTDSGDHEQARKLCVACPMLADCNDLAKRVSRGDRISQMAGTWAGRLYGRTNAQERAERIRVEDAMFTDDDARKAHARYVAGDRDDRARIGERVYSRRNRRGQRSAA